MSLGGLITHFFLLMSDIPLYRCTTVCLSQVTPYEGTSWLLPVFVNNELSCYKHSCAGFCMNMFSINLGKYLGTWLLNHIVRQCQLKKNPDQMSSKVAVPFCSLISNEWEFLLFQVLTSIWWCQYLDLGHSERCVVESHVLICNSLITYDVGHLFICLFVIYLSSLVRCLFGYFAHF